MLLDIKKLLNSVQQTAAGSFTADLSGESFPAGFMPLVPAEIGYSAERVEDSVSLRLSVRCKAEIECNRCLTVVQRTQEIRQEYILCEADYSCADPELPFDQSGKLDLRELAYQEILLSLPTVLLCRPDCEGLCPVCGLPIRNGCQCGKDGQGKVIPLPSIPF